MKQYVTSRCSRIKVWLLLLLRLLSILFLIVLTTVVINAQEETNVLCQDILTDFASCLVTTFDTQNDAILCDTCRLEYSNYINNVTSSTVSTTSTTCNDIETIQCLAIKECPCNTCDIQLEEYFNCEYMNSNFYINNQCISSILDCRTSIVNCDNSFNEYRNCIYRLPISNDNNNDTSNINTINGKACDDCRLNVASNFVNGGTCNAAQTNFCIGINETCATVCGNCIDEMDFFFTCDVLDKSNGNCQIDCNTTTTSTPPISDEPLCSNELSDFAICVTQDLTSDTDSVACDTCRINVETSIIETSISNNNTCSNIQQVTCNEAIPNCTDVCGTCIAPLANYWICYSSIISFLDCSSVTCNLVNSPNRVPSSPVLAPTTSIPSPLSTPTTNSPIILPLSAPSQVPIITPVVNNPQAMPVSMSITQPSSGSSPNTSPPTITSQATIIVSNKPKWIISLIAILYLVS